MRLVQGQWFLKSDEISEIARSGLEDTEPDVNVYLFNMVIVGYVLDGDRLGHSRRAIPWQQQALRVNKDVPLKP